LGASAEGGYYLNRRANLRKGDNLKHLAILSLQMLIGVYIQSSIMTQTACSLGFLSMPLTSTKRKLPKTPSLLGDWLTHFIRPPNLPPYLPLASRVKPLQLSSLESQRAFLLATPRLLETHIMKTYKSITQPLAECIAYLPNRLWRMRIGTGSGAFLNIGHRAKRAPSPRERAGVRGTAAFASQVLSPRRHYTRCQPTVL
jgi:hypothetical protein